VLLLLAGLVPGPVGVAVEADGCILGGIEEIHQRAGAVDSALPKAEMHFAPVNVETELRSGRSLIGLSLDIRPGLLRQRLGDCDGESGKCEQDRFQRLLLKDAGR
jgi:hypothetical protein